MEADVLLPRKAEKSVLNIQAGEWSCDKSSAAIIPGFVDRIRVLRTFTSWYELEL